MTALPVLPLEAQDLIPHRKPMRLVHRLIARQDRSILVEANVEPDNPLVDSGGRLEAAGLLELLAQACAMLRGFLDPSEESPAKIGFLVGVRRLTVHGEARVGDRLLIDVKTVGSLDGFLIAEGEIRRGADLLASGALRLWVTDAVPGMRP